MNDALPDNVIDFNLAKQHREEQQEIEETHRFIIEIEGELSFDSLDELIEHLEDQGFDVDCFIPPKITKTPAVIIKGLSYDPLPQRS